MKQQDPPFLPRHVDPPPLPPRDEHPMLPPHENHTLLPLHEDRVLLPRHPDHPLSPHDGQGPRLDGSPMPGHGGQRFAPFAEMGSDGLEDPAVCGTWNRSVDDGARSGNRPDERAGAGAQAGNRPKDGAATGASSGNSSDKGAGTRDGNGADSELSNMEQLLDRIERAVHDGEEKVSLDAILDEVGRRSFGPLLLLAGVVTLMPILGDIPGVPSVMGILVIVTALQLLVARDHFWLPQWILRRTVSRGALCKGLGWMRKPARFLDRLLKPRIPWLVKGPGFALIAAVCLLIGLMLPPMEFVPFSANGAGLALTIFGLAIIARDGAAALLGLAITGGTVALVTMGLM